LNGTNGQAVSGGSDSNNTDLLNYCLADAEWLMEMFDKFKHLLIEVDSFMSVCQAELGIDGQQNNNINGISHNVLELPI
jgi:hypothetical protein